MASVFGKKGTHYYIESVMLSTYVHILKSTYILQSTNHEPLSKLYLRDTEGLECTQSQS